MWHLTHLCLWSFIFSFFFSSLSLSLAISRSPCSIRSKWERSIARQWMQFLNELNATHSKTRKKLQRMQMFHHSVFLYARRELCARYVLSHLHFIYIKEEKKKIILKATKTADKISNDVKYMREWATTNMQKTKTNIFIYTFTTMPCDAMHYDVIQ